MHAGPWGLPQVNTHLAFVSDGPIMLDLYGPMARARIRIGGGGGGGGGGGAVSTPVVR